MSGGSAAESSLTTAGRKGVNNGVIGSESMIVSNVSDHGESSYVTRVFYNSSVKPKEVSSLMARKFKNVTATFPERVKTKVFDQSARFNLVQEPSVKAHKSPSSSRNGDQFTFSHPFVQTQSLRFNDKSSSYISKGHLLRV